MCRHNASLPIAYFAAIESSEAPAIRVASMRARSGCLQTVQAGPFLDLSLDRVVTVSGSVGDMPLLEHPVAVWTPSEWWFNALVAVWTPSKRLIRGYR
jgi:hypothetical protein